MIHCIKMTGLISADLRMSVEKMISAVVDVLSLKLPSIYLYGSVSLGDFKLGWSDIDVLVLTKEQITEKQANELLYLRQTLLVKEPDNPYYRSFEGGILTLDAFINKTPDRVVYWGTSGQKITDSYNYDSFSLCVLKENGILLYGDDVRDGIHMPTYDNLKNDVKNHLNSIRQYAYLTGKSLYSFGWLFDISRCIYTLRTGKIIAKTAAGEWALQNGICPVSETLEFALKVRNSPLLYKTDKSVLEYAGTINDDVMKYADVLENELRENDNGE